MKNARGLAAGSDTLDNLAKFTDPKMALIPRIFAKRGLQPAFNSLKLRTGKGLESLAKKSVFAIVRKLNDNVRRQFLLWALTAKEDKVNEQHE